MAAFSVRVIFAPILDENAPFLLFVAAVLIAATVGGIGPGLLSVALSIALALVFVVDFDRGGVANLIAFSVIGTAIAVAGEWLLRVRRDAARATADANAREAHLQSILDTVPDAMIVIDEQGIMRSFSSAAERLFGYSAAEAIGRELPAILITSQPSLSLRRRAAAANVPIIEKPLLGDALLDAIRDALTEVSAGTT